MIDILIKKFIKDYKNTDDKNVRIKYGIFSSIIGILSYILLFLIKFIIGCFLGSIAIIADSLHNLVDVGSSIASLVGFKMSKKPADSNHPFGYGRIEYISTLVVSIIIFLLGYEFFKISLTKIINPNDISFNLTSIIIVILTTIVNMWQYLFYKKIGNRINSKPLLAASKENLNDIFITIGAILSVIFYYCVGINIDGYVGVLISIVIIYSSYSIAKDVISTLIGEPPSAEFVNKIKDKVLSYDGILGIHDMIVHNYGPNNSMVILHAELSNQKSMDESHDLVDKVEREVEKELGVLLVIHMDPIDINDKRIDHIIDVLEDYRKTLEFFIDFHDFRIVNIGNKCKVIFDLELPHSINNKDKNLVIENINKLIKNINNNYELSIDIEYSYVKRN